jgi:hypothetical protein
MLKRVMKDHWLNSNNEIEEVIASARNELTFDDVQSVFRNWTSRLANVIKNGGQDTLESIRYNFLMLTECVHRTGAEASLPLGYIKEIPLNTDYPELTNHLDISQEEI